MTRLHTTGLASLVFGFTLGGTAAAESPHPAQHEDDAAPATSDMPAASTAPGDIDRDLHTHDPTDTTPPPVESPTVYVAPTTVVETDTDDGWRGDMRRYGIAIAAGGGTGGFTNDAMRDAANLGGEWDVRVSVGTRSPLALEASYIGSAQSISALGLDDNAILVGNGAQAALRLNTTIDFPVQPFVFGGAAWRRYDLTNAAFNTSDVNDSDNVIEFPLGVGLAGRWNGLILDARGEFRPTIDNDLLPELTGTDGIGNDNFASMHRWAVNASVGYEF